MGEAARVRETDGAVDVRSLMAEIRVKVRQDVEANKDKLPKFEMTKPDPSGRSAKAGDLTHSEELRFLNASVTEGLRLDLSRITSHRAGPIGRAIVTVKRKLLKFLWDGVLAGIFERDLEYRRQLVRFLNQSTRYIDERDSDTFWQLIHKIDTDVGNALDRVEILHDEAMSELRSAEKRVFSSLGTAPGELSRRLALAEQRGAEQAAAVDALSRVVGGLEGLLAQYGKAAAAGARETTAEGPQSAPPDLTYLLLENRFRGSQEEIRSRLGIYPELFPKGSPRPVLDLGCGRGELLKLFAGAGVNAYGIDLDEGMLREADALGLPVQRGDGIEHLATLDDGALQGVIAIQVVEHLPVQILRQLIARAARKVAPGGRVIFETINPKSLLALSSNYFRDLTHVFPLHPDTLAFEMSLAGLEIEEIRYLSPVGEDATLKPIPTDEFFSPRWLHLVERINGTIAQLNDLLYGFQDYCVIARVRP